MEKRCTFKKIENGWECEICGRVAKINTKEPPIAICKSGDTVEYPRMTKMMSNFVSATKKYYDSGFKNVSIDEYRNRINTCQGDDDGLPCLHYDNGRCKHSDCGCFLAAKCWITTEKCPIGRW